MKLRRVASKLITLKFAENFHRQIWTFYNETHSSKHKLFVLFLVELRMRNLWMVIDYDYDISIFWIENTMRIKSICITKSTVSMKTKKGKFY